MSERLDRKWQAISLSAAVAACGIPRGLDRLWTARIGEDVSPITVLGDHEDLLEALDEYVDSVCPADRRISATALEHGDWSFGPVDRLLRQLIERLGTEVAQPLLVRFPRAAAVILGQNDSASSADAIDTQSECEAAFVEAPHRAATDRVIDEGVQLFDVLLRALETKGAQPVISVINAHALDVRSARWLQRMVENADRTRLRLMVLCRVNDEPSPFNRTLKVPLQAFSEVARLAPMVAYSLAYVEGVARRTKLPEEAVTRLRAFGTHGLLAQRDLVTWFRAEGVLIGPWSEEWRAMWKPLSMRLPVSHAELVRSLLDRFGAKARARIEALAFAGWEPTITQLESMIIARAGSVDGPPAPADALMTPVQIGSAWRRLLRASASEADARGISRTWLQLLLGESHNASAHGAVAHLALDAGDELLLASRGTEIARRAFEHAGDRRAARGFYAAALEHVHVPASRASYLGRLGRICITMGETAEGEKYFEEALASESSPLRIAMLSHEYTSVVIRHARQLASADRLLQQGREALPAIVDVDERRFAEARITAGEALVLYRQGDAVAATSRMTAAVDLLGAISSQRPLLKGYAVVVRRHLAHLATLRRDFAEFVRQHCAIGALSLTLGRWDDASWSAVALGLRHLHVGEPSRAAVCFEGAFGLASRGRTSLSAICDVIVRESCRLGLGDEGMRYVQRSADYYEQAGMPFQQKRVWMKQSTQFLDAGMAEQAKACLAA